MFYNIALLLQKNKIQIYNHFFCNKLSLKGILHQSIKQILILLLALFYQGLLISIFSTIWENRF